VSVKTLRYYDKLNIIKPIMTDKFTGYRYYDENQLNDMLTIKRLKRYGFSLAEIKSFLDSGDKRALFLKLKQCAEIIQTDIGHKRMILNEINSIVENFERTGEFMNYQGNYQISVSESEKIYIISSRQRMSVEDFGKYYGRLFKKIGEENITPSGIVLAIYHDKEWNEKDSDIELGVGIKDMQKADGCVGGCLCAKTTHKGSYANLPEAYASVLKWINANGYKIAAPPYEIYRKDGSSGIPVEEWETDIYFPVEKL